MAYIYDSNGNVVNSDTGELKNSPKNVTATEPTANAVGTVAGSVAQSGNGGGAVTQTAQPSTTTGNTYVMPEWIQKNQQPAQQQAQPAQTAQPTQPTQPVHESVAPKMPYNMWSKKVSGEQKDWNNAVLQAGVDANEATRQQVAEHPGAEYDKNANMYFYKNPETGETGHINPQGNSTTAITNAQKQYAEQHPEEFGAKKKEPEDTRSEYQKFKDSMYDEGKIRKASDRKAKIMAVGDALRNIGNLYYTTKGATPQKFGTNFGEQERNDYETGKMAREQIAYNRYQAKLKQDAQDAENKRKNLELHNTLLNGESNRKLNDAKIQKMYTDLNIQLDKYPYEKQKLVAEAVRAVAMGNKAEAEAKLKQLDVENYPELLALKKGVLQSTIDKNKKQGDASMINARNNTRRTNAYINKIDNDIKGGTQHFDGAYKYKLRKALTTDQKSNLVEALHNAGKVNDEDYETYKTSPSYASKIISDAIQYGDSNQTHSILLKNGFDDDSGYNGDGFTF